MDTICRGCGRKKEEEKGPVFQPKKKAEWVHRFGFDLCPDCWDRHERSLKAQREEEMEEECATC
jgi:hypothetical protein